MPPYPPPSLSKKEAGKARRRHAQKLKVEQKNRENAEYFWRCAEEEERLKKSGKNKKPSEASREELFSRQASSGINFSQVGLSLQRFYSKRNCLILP